MPATANTVPVQPYETRESVLLSRARDFIREMLDYRDPGPRCPECGEHDPRLIAPFDRVEVTALEYDIDSYLTGLAQNARRRA